MACWCGHTWLAKPNNLRVALGYSYFNDGLIVRKDSNCSAQSRD